jgi:hypothetical protein
MVELMALLLVASTPRVEDSAARGLQITGDFGCPTAEDVARSLARLHPDLEARGFTLELSASGSDLGLRVLDPSRALVGERRFTGLPDCAQRADAVAATVAVWLTELSVQLPPQSLGADATVEAPPPALEAAARPRPVEIGTSAAQATSPTRLHWQLELGAAALGAIDQTGAGAGGIELGGAVRPLAQWWGLQARLAWEAPRSIALGPGFADWQRVTLGAGAHFPLQRGTTGFELEADLLAGLAVTQGRGLTVSHLDAGLEPGLFAGARFFVDPWPAWRGWLKVGVALWPVRQQVGLFAANASSPADVASLPQVELLVTLGGSWLN